VGPRQVVRQRRKRGGVPPHAVGPEGHQPGRHGRVGGRGDCGGHRGGGSKSWTSRGWTWAAVTRRG
jgi:hypothetical protein